MSNFCEECGFAHAADESCNNAEKKREYFEKEIADHDLQCGCNDKYGHVRRDNRKKTEGLIAE